MSHHIRHNCRLCRSRELDTVLTLRPTPPANEFVKAGDPDQDKYPLYLVQCNACGHVQLPVVIDPKRLFGNYVYVSGTSPAFVDHFRKYAEKMIADHHLVPGDLVVEIGSNDGTLLKFFKDYGCRVVGVDPAEAIAARASESGIETLPCFFDRMAAHLIQAKHGAATLVLANNVFAHADDLHEITMGARNLLDPARGRFVFEVQSLLDLVKDCLFDMIYHEHLSYHTLDPLVPFFHELSMEIIDCEHVDTHGGSLRVTVTSKPGPSPRDSVAETIRQERDALHDGVFETLSQRINVAGSRLQEFIQNLPGGQVLAGFGAPAKLTTLMHQFGLTAGDIAYVIDDSPWKQGLLTPGTRIPVVSSKYLSEDPPDRVVIFAWNFADQIAAKHPELAGKFVVPLPTYREI